MIKVGYLVSYDYVWIYPSIELLYPYVSKIYLAIDQDYLTWSGNPIAINKDFFDKIKTLDTKDKIEFYYDRFYVPTISPMECEIRERNKLLQKMGKGWLIQLDADEYLYDFKKVKQFLGKYWYLTLFPKLTPVAFRGVLVTLFKKTETGYLYIDNNERFPFITNYPKYISARRNNEIKNHFFNAKVIHQSWARTEDEIAFKIKNWGHRDDFDTQKFYDFWKNLDASNYKQIQNFHPLVPHVWDKLYFLEAQNIEEFIKKYADLHPQKLIRFQGVNKWGFLKSLFSKIVKN